MDKQHRGGRYISLYFPAKQSSFPMLLHEMDPMRLPFPSEEEEEEVVFGDNQRGKATQKIDHSNLNGICLLQRDK